MKLNCLKHHQPSNTKLGIVCRITKIANIWIFNKLDNTLTFLLGYFFGKSCLGSPAVFLIVNSGNQLPYGLFHFPPHPDYLVQD